jgi:hypothetical protein
VTIVRMPAASALCLALTIAAAAYAQRPAVNEDAQIMAALDKRIKDYSALHEKLEATLPELSKDSAPQQVDAHQRTLAALIHKERHDPHHGDVFGPAARALIRRLLARALSGPDAKELRTAIMEDNPGPLRVQVNGRLADDIPRSTIPAQVLQMLPRLPEAVEYRFLGRRLVLVDAHALIVVDYVDDALPK